MSRSATREAISELQRAVYLSPYDHEAHLLLGRVYLRGGRLQDAIDALKISIWSSERCRLAWSSPRPMRRRDGERGEDRVAKNSSRGTLRTSRRGSGSNRLSAR